MAKTLFINGCAVNNITITHPEIAAEWDYDENGDNRPEMFTAGMRYRAHWRCRKCGNKWQAYIYSRTNGNHGCNVCKSREAGAKIAKPKDGESFADLYPEAAAEWVEREDGKTPYDVKPGSGYKALWECHVCEGRWETEVYHRRDGNGCPYCKNRRLLVGYNDLATKCPDIAAEWDSENEKSPSEVIYASGERASFICSTCGEKWTTKVRDRTVLGHGCKHCHDKASEERIKASARARRKPHEQFVREVAEAGGGVTVIGRYVNAKTKVRVRCDKCGREWDAYPNGLLKGGGCDKCADERHKVSKEEFLRRISESSPNAMLVSEYTMASDKMDFKCRVCGHRWTTTGQSVMQGTGCAACMGNVPMTYEKLVESLAKVSPTITLMEGPDGDLRRPKVKCDVCGWEWDAARGNLLAGTGCPYCAGQVQMSHEEFVAEMAEKAPDVEVLGTFTKRTGKVEVRCRKCGRRWSAQARKLLGETGCSKCAGNLARTHEEFVAEIAKINPDIEILGHYKNVGTPIEARCKKCKYVWSPSPSNLLNGSGCLNCKGMAPKSNEDFLAEVEEKNPMVKPLEEYQGALHRIEFECRNCGHRWHATPSAILRGSGCGECCTAKRSFFEHAILCAFRSVLGHDEVLSCDRKAVGYELDVYIPSMKLAFEPGSWYFHEKRPAQGLDKMAACNARGIELVTIYTSYPMGATIPLGAIVTEKNMGPSDWDDVVDMISGFMSVRGLDPSAVDWASVRKDAMSFSGRITTDKYIEKLAKVNPDIEVIGDYVNAKGPIEVRCRVCGAVWSPSASSLLSGTGCRVCSLKKNAERQRKPFEEVVAEAAATSPDIEILGEYVRYDAPMTVRCKKCGWRWELSFAQLKKGKTCPECGPNHYIKSHEDFVKALAEKSPDATPLEEYKGGDTEIMFECAKCGNKWPAKPKNLMAGHGCPECGRKKCDKKRKKTHEDFVRQMAERRPDVEVVGRYTGARDKMKFGCRVCGGTWYATPDNILRGRGCTHCRYKKMSETRKRNKAKK